MRFKLEDEVEIAREERRSDLRRQLVDWKRNLDKERDRAFAKITKVSEQKIQEQALLIKTQQ